MSLVRLDETSERGKVFADWLREKLLAVGDATERTKRLARGELSVYVLTNLYLDGFAGGKRPLVGGWHVRPCVNGDEPVAPLAEIEADLYDGERPLAVVCDANGAVLIAASAWRFGIALHKGDYCTVLPSAMVAEKLERTKYEHADCGGCGEAIE